MTCSPVLLRKPIQRRQFTADAAHEPHALAAIKINLQNALRRTGETRTLQSPNGLWRPWIVCRTHRTDAGPQPH